MRRSIFATLTAMALCVGAQAQVVGNQPIPYRTGSFTPTITALTTPPSGVTYAQQNGVYTVLGDTVFVSGFLQTSSMGTGGVGTLAIGGMPCTSSNTFPNNVGAVVLVIPNTGVLALDALYFAFNGFIFNNATSFQILEIGSNIRTGLPYANMTAGLIRFTLQYKYASCP